MTSGYSIIKNRRCAIAAWSGLTLCLAALMAASAAWAGTAGEGVRARLANPQVLRGQFEQEKHLQGFKNPLLSKGDFLLARDRGVVWNTRSPFASTLVLTRQHLLAKRADGSAQSIGDQAGSPAISTANTLLMALLGGDMEILSGQFDLHETLVVDGSWRLQLVPKPGALKKIFRLIELRGDQHVRSVRLEEVRGDYTDIRFLQLRDTPDTLSAEEAKQLD